MWPGEVNAVPCQAALHGSLIKRSVMYTESPGALEATLLLHIMPQNKTNTEGGCFPAYFGGIRSYFILRQHYKPLN